MARFWIRGFGWFGSGLCLCGGLTWASPLYACHPAHAEGDVDGLPLPWREALDALVLATADASQPWGCPNAALALDVDDAGATLRVTRVGTDPLERRLASPDDVVPLGKAVLAQPL